MTELETGCLTENDVVNAVADYLKAEGWKVAQALSTLQRGVDLIAERNGIRLHLEAKGATSSKSTSNRFGTPFDRSQVFDHVSKAVHKALAVVAQNDGTQAALAFPDNELHRLFAGKVAPALARLGVSTFFVAAPNVVRVEGLVQ